MPSPSLPPNGGAVFSNGYSPGPVTGLPTSRDDGFAMSTIDTRARNALICGVFAIFPFSILTGIPAIILGRRALQHIALFDGELRGRGHAIAAVVLGSLSVLIFVVAMVAIYA
jgi:hypothetical protein